METYGLETLCIINASAVYRNLPPAQLTEHALRRGEGKLSNTGALVVKTGKYTGRSANDKFIVDTPAVHDEIAWGKVNRPIEKAKFDAIKSKVIAYLQGKEIFIFDGFAGADPKYTQSFRIVNELAYLLRILGFLASLAGELFFEVVFALVVEDDALSCGVDG